jgi:hypothetical protein
MSNSNVHATNNVPRLLVGGGAGRLKGGRHLRYPEGTYCANLLLSVMDILGVPQERVGNSNGRLRLDTLTGI